MKLLRQPDVEAAALEAARLVKAQIGTPDEAKAIVLGVFRAELPELFPTPTPPAPPPGSPGGP